MHTLPTHERRRLLREIIYHEEALTRQTWEQPPIQPGDHASSYADMLRDPAVAYGVNIIQDAILAEPWHVEPAETGSAKHAALAVEMHRNLQDLDVESALHDALDAIWRGFRAHEITWRYQDRHHRLDTLAAIDPDQVALELDERMRVTAVLSRPAGGPRQRIPVEKVWLHVHRPSRTRPAGDSILEPAYRAWNNKNRLLQFWGLSIQRFGMTAFKVTVPANTPPSRQSQITTQLLAGRLDGVYLVPEDVEVEPMNPTQWANLTFEQAVNYADSEIVKAILLIHHPGGQADGRTYVTGAGLEVLARSTAYRLQRISRALANSFNAQVIQPLCMANWGVPPAECPRLVLPHPDPARIVALAPALAQLSGAGIADAETAAALLGFPEPTVQPKSEKGAKSEDLPGRVRNPKSEDRNA